jgi:hypothetical protein
MSNLYPVYSNCSNQNIACTVFDQVILLNGTNASLSSKNIGFNPLQVGEIAIVTDRKELVTQFCIGDFRRIPFPAPTECRNNTAVDFQMGRSCNAQSATGSYSVIAGGRDNTSSGSYSNIVGGRCNTASGNYSNVVGGCCNIASGDCSSILGGKNNCASGWGSNITGGASNTASGYGSHVGGGIGNCAIGDFSIATGFFNTSHTDGIVTGGNDNTACCSSNIAGGGQNCASGCRTTIAGGRYNTTSGSYSNVAGGRCNTASGSYSNIAGGRSNIASGNCSNVAGGFTNTASASSSNVAGGRCNTASGNYSNVTGGGLNRASGSFSFVAGGSANDTRGFANTFILGTRLSASQANFTYVNNLSSQGIVSTSSISANNIFGQSEETVFTDGSSLVGNGNNTLTFNYQNGVYTNSILALSGLGYRQGAGSSVAQSGSRTSTVIANTPTGRITLVTATLNANTSTSFTLTNSFVTSTDLILVQHVSGGTLGLYNITATPNTGSATITIRNNSASNSPSEAPVLQFAIVRSAIA